MSTARLNDEDRRQWILNDEGLYNWWKRENRGERDIRGFIRRNKAELDCHIYRRLDTKPARY